MARLTLDKVLASALDSDDDSDDFGHLDSESEEEMKECLPILTIQPGDAGST